MSQTISIRYSSAYEGTIAYVTDRSRFILHDSVSIEFNKVFRRGLFSVTDGSQILMSDVEIMSNKIGLDSAVLFAENNRVEYHLIDGSFVVSAMEKIVLLSWIDDTVIRRNEIVEGGRLMSITDSNFTVTNVQF